MVDVLVVFDGRALGVVAGGRRGRRETAEQATGVLLLPIYELLHEAFPGAHNNTAERVSGANQSEERGFSRKLCRNRAPRCDNVFCRIFFLLHGEMTLSLQEDTFITASVTGKLISAAAD